MKEKKESSKEIKESKESKKVVVVVNARERIRKRSPLEEVVKEAERKQDY